MNTAKMNSPAMIDGSPLMASTKIRTGRRSFERLSLSPGALRTMYPVCDLDVDVRSVLGSIRVPTLVFHRRDNFWIPVAFGRYLAQHIADARFVEIEGIDHRYYQGNADGMLSAVQEFVTGEHEAPEDDRVLATVLFTDIVGSTEKATSLGDQAWGDLLVRHHAVVRREIAHFRGREVATAGGKPDDHGALVVGRGGAGDETGAFHRLRDRLVLLRD